MPMRTLINKVQIFDGAGTAPFKGSVAVEGERIVQISRDGMFSSGLEARSGDKIIDGKGLTLMPGLVEGHAHLSWGSSVEKIYHQFELPMDELKVATWRNARVLLEHGFTSLYSAGALGDGLETELASEIKAGKSPGPRLLPSTIERSPEGAEGVETGNAFHGRGPEAMRAFVKHCADTGVKIVKLVISGEDALKPGSSQDILYTEEEVAAACEAARAAGLWVSAHTYTPAAIQMALRHGVRVVYHCSWADAATIDMMAAKKDEIFYAPAVGVLIGTLEAKPPPHIDMSSMKRSAEEVLALDKKLVPELKKRGVRVLIGGDYGFPFNPNGRNARDLEHFVTQFGYTPAEALSAATMLGGQVMGMGDELGLVREGYLADLLLVDGDPTKDVRVLQDKARLKMIMKGGAIYQPAA
jgi:imidazolonepropionase-like amidohydrolase